MRRPKSDLRRMAAIQDKLLTHIKSELNTEDDHLYMATMLLKHSIALYKTLLDDDEIKNMLGHVIDTVEQDYAVFTPSKKSKETLH